MQQLLERDIVDIVAISDIKEVHMADLLIRGIDEETKRRLAVQAAKNGRSQQAEAKAILEAALEEKNEKTWIDVLMEGAKEVGGYNLELPERLPAREFRFDDEEH